MTTNFQTKFRDTKNRLYTSALFKEVSAKPELILYSLAREDNEYPSLYKLYMEMGDLVEYDFATKYFESFQHWKQICGLEWFCTHIGDWREELELRFRAIALKSLINRSDTSIEVAKYLLNNNWVAKLHEANPLVNNRGRPSKSEIKGHLQLITNNQIQEQKDYERISRI